jgi:hypothetical protein
MNPLRAPTIALLGVASLLTWGCARGADPTTGDTTPEDSTPVATETSSPEDSDETLDPSQLFGTVPESPIAAPDFQAVNEHGELRDRSALLGHPTVMWFFPLSGTPG